MSKIQSKENIKDLHVVFKTHLDIGFTDFAYKVKEQYMEDFIPRAIKLSKEIEEKRPDLSFVWTTGSWLIYEALETYQGKQLKEFEQAVSEGQIAWHGLPFTMHSEMMDESLFRFGLSYSKKLDERFGKKTIAAKMTDVPGHTRAIVPLLAEAGIKFLHIGLNPGSTAPDVPKAFVWRHSDGSEITVLYDSKEYGELSILSEYSFGLALASTEDNIGPPDFNSVVNAIDKYQKILPNTNINISTLDDFGKKLYNVRKSLPVFESEIGDTWIHGIASDPLRTSKFLTLQRLRNKLLKKVTTRNEECELKAFSRSLIMIPEHTWGVDVKTYMKDHVNYSSNDLEKLKNTDGYKTLESSWQEQRNFIDHAVCLLGAGDFRKEAEYEMSKITAEYPKREGFDEIKDKNRIFNASWLSLGFNSNTGEISHLHDTGSKKTWAAEKFPLAGFVYETFTAEDYDRFGYQYLRNWPNSLEWVPEDFTKPGIEKLNLKHEIVKPKLKSLWYRGDAAGDNYFILEMNMPKFVVVNYGAPEKITLEIHVHSDEKIIDFDLQWFNKQACRLPEASWFSFSPKIISASCWSIKKMNSWFSPNEVVKNGNRKLHASESVKYDDGVNNLTIVPYDSPLVAPGERSLLNFNNKRPPMKNGVHFNLHNNIWGTNFRMWYGEDTRFRFRLKLDNKK
ncbi:MAG: DUF5054 domain-containing protein [bacterium]|nr:DUF5054 domain-containing protein [bacterium]